MRLFRWLSQEVWYTDHLTRARARLTTARVTARVAPRVTARDREKERERKRGGAGAWV